MIFAGVTGTGRPQKLRTFGFGSSNLPACIKNGDVGGATPPASIFWRIQWLKV